MKRVRIAELKDHLSAHLRSVERGEEIEVLDRERPVARIVPVDPARAVSAAPPRRGFETIRDRRYPAADWPVSSTGLLLEDRRKR